MVNCCVPGCTNYSAKTVDVSYHKIPSDKQRRKAWLDRIRRSNMPQVQYSYVCSDHFLPSCFELDHRSKLTTQKCKRRLKEDAIPSEFKYSPEAKKPRLSSENRQDRRRHQEVSGLFYILCCYDLFSSLKCLLTRKLCWVIRLTKFGSTLCTAMFLLIGRIFI